MAGFLGEYEATIDAKGRFLLPGGLKKQMPEGTTTMVISRGFEKCLLLYPQKSWETIEEKIKKLNEFNPKVSQFRTLFVGGASYVELDSAGRILLPPSLREYAGLGKDILLASDIDKIKIWDSGKYKKLFEDFSSDAFASLASDVTAGINF
ncbi:division/cell wall cluster transcriptional repressor MraZ [Parafilimonas terrae]|uniref:Transcriptional regulator MraZ n=1 Tax=Parafilimonas terrae TaxID=1465490 RepID=A0A1I5Z9Y9_9BACT|nr:division/cell wall cluster transcriptional repressor MraZ [Parafilimonas terrae]SFQ53244.1 MraZ protein [Parafilimonas terrae]